MPLLTINIHVWLSPRVPLIVMTRMHAVYLLISFVTDHLVKLGVVIPSVSDRELAVLRLHQGELA